jgi:hypothetical protein
VKIDLTSSVSIASKMSELVGKKEEAEVPEIASKAGELDKEASKAPEGEKETTTEAAAPTATKGDKTPAGSEGKSEDAGAKSSEEEPKKEKVEEESETVEEVRNRRAAST